LLHNVLSSALSLCVDGGLFVNKSLVSMTRRKVTTSIDPIFTLPYTFDDNKLHSLACQPTTRDVSGSAICRTLSTANNFALKHHERFRFHT
jgi:hypothetical protein